MATSSEVPGRLPIAIDGHPYAIDPAEYQRSSLPVLRQQSDQSDEPGEASFNPRGLWRRSQDSWHHGAGQVFFDGKQGGTASDPERFRTSYRADPWTRGQVSLHKEVTQVRTSGRQVIAVQNTAYVRDGQQVYWYTNPTSTAQTWTSSVIHNGQTATTVQSITTDGQYVWAACGSSGLHRTAVTATVSTHDVPAQACTLVGYALGRLLIANNNVLYEVTSPITAPVAAAIPGGSHPDPSFKWRFIRPGRNCIYVGGSVEGGAIDLGVGLFEGGISEIYKITLNPTDTSLSAPSPAAYLPDGEIVYDCRFYAGGVIIATSRGVRVGVADQAGNIDYGPLIDVKAPAGTSYRFVTALEPQDRYVWCGTSSSSGPQLRRVDLGHFTDTLVPAWAPDVEINMAEDGYVDGVCSLVNGALLMSYNGAGGGMTPDGVFRREASILAPSATFETGEIRFGTTETKTVRAVEIRCLPLPAGASIAVAYSVNGEAYVTAGTVSTTGATSGSFTIGAVATSVTAETIQLRFTLTRATVNTTGPTLLRWTLKALPTPTRNETFLLPILMYRTVDTHAGDGQPHAQDVDAEVAFLKGLEQAGTIFDFQVGHETHVGYIEESRFSGEKFSFGYDRHPEGVFTVQITTVNG